MADEKPAIARPTCSILDTNVLDGLLIVSPPNFPAAT